jgi:8-oxo-dGTP pyrophosphatase MutT (NUDIX family)
LNFVDVETRLVHALAGPLPGLHAQLHFAPRPRPGWKPGVDPEHARPAAGLLLLFPVGGEARLLLTVRASHLPKHAGQVSLPGGRVEPGETIEQAAMREALEEVGLDSGPVRVIGRLTPLHIPVSGFMLHPVVALTDTRPALRPADCEVERILDVGVDELLDPARRLWRRMRHEERGDLEVPYIDLRGAELWGATAMVLAELLSLLAPGWPFTQ